MGSRRAARKPRSHARPGGGHRTRNTTLVLGAAVLTAGVGFALNGIGGDGDGGASDRVAASTVDQAPSAEETSPSASPSTSASASPEASPSKKAEKKKASKSASPTRTATPTQAAKAPERPSTKAGGDRGTGGGSASGPGSGAGGSGSSGGSAETQVIALVNQERAAAGCSPLTANARLTRAADDYSDVMAASGVMSHTGPDGSTMTTRVEAAGYQWSTLGENIARGQADAASVMKSWMNSPGHRANILNCSFKEIGVGVHFGDGGPWWTQNFGASR
ncbi:CAP domain-containing protein [Streptomyces sp. H28]|uniref:CAP domain-containing protein n=1 Tax=Streptomyces sp. H28 TaxID=2775865 RepID=UPI0017821CEB|nr:CAP domain-containing protein [Streptomyces sp. H28]MBD9732667.1 CAP domain-containing protein [Streptomyces sp. H28]